MSFLSKVSLPTQSLISKKKTGFLSSVTMPTVQSLREYEFKKYSIEAEREMAKTSSLGELIKEGITGTFPATVESLKEIQLDPLSYKNMPDKVTRTSWIKNYWQKLKDAVNQSGAQINAALEKGQTATTISGKIGATAETVARLGGIIFAPITAYFEATKNVPVLGTVTKLISLPFVAIGDVTPKVSDEIIDQLPISKEAKENIKPGVGEILTLAGQLALGKVTDIAAKKVGLVKKYGERDAQTIINEASKLAKEKATTESIALGFLAKVEKPEAIPEAKIASVEGVQSKVAILSKEATNSLENQKIGIKPSSLERAKTEIQAGNTPPVKIRILEDGTKFIEDGRNHLEAARQLGLKDYPIEDVTSKYIQPLAQEARKIDKLGQELLHNAKRTIENFDEKPTIEIANNIAKLNGDRIIKAENVAEALQYTDPVAEIKRVAELQKSGQTKYTLETSPHLARMKEVLGEQKYNDYFNQATKGVEVKPIEIKPQEISVPREQLPIGEGAEKVSRLEARVTDSLKKTSPEDIERLGLTTYKEMNKIETIKAASEYVIKNPKEALDVLEGKIEPPKGILRNSIYVVMENAAADNVALARKLTTLTATRMGQELSILTELNPDSPVKIMRDVIKIKESVVEKRTGKKVEQIQKETAQEIKTEIKKSASKRPTWEEFIKEIMCNY